MPKRPIVAIIDDDQSAREGLIELVTSMGFNAEAFERAEDFLQSQHVERVGCLITDLRMPGMSGLELLDRLRASGRAIPTIVITAFTQEADRKRVLSAGAICYLPKPLHGNDLLEQIQAALSMRP